jgi:hypothetical protein
METSERIAESNGNSIALGLLNFEHTSKAKSRIPVVTRAAEKPSGIKSSA